MFGITMVFSLMLYLLFPKDNIDKILEGRGKNTNLSINYLESMLLYHPDNRKIKMLLIENYTYARKYTKALEMNNQLIPTTTDREELKKLYKSQYTLMKELYFQSDNEYLLRGIKEKLYRYFLFTKGERDYTFFFIESTQLDFQKLKYVSLRGFLKEKPELRIYPLEKDAFTQAKALGLEDEAYEYLLNLLNYKEVDIEIERYALSLFLEKKKYQKARQLATKFFLNSTERNEQIKYFNIALGAIINAKSETSAQEVMALISLYQKNIELESSDIKFLIKALLQIGDLEGASTFAVKAFREHRDKFNQEVTEVAINSLIWHKQLDSALEIALFAKDKFKSVKWLDKSIELSLWQGKIQKAIKLNIEGYRQQNKSIKKEPKYEKYLLASTTMHTAYDILGEIYTNKLESGDFTAIKKLSKYYEYTGELNDAEEYFGSLMKKVKHKEIHKQAILFSYKNSHYEKGLELYKKYKNLYGTDKELQDEAVQKLISLKRFKEAFAFAKALKEDKRLTDLGWVQKDYKFIYKSLWKAEKSNHLAYDNYYKLIRLEGVLNKGEKINYLYKKLWKKTKKRKYLTALFYRHLEKKNLDAIKTLISSLNSKDRAYLEKNIQYQIAMANYFIEKKDIPSAMKIFRKVLKDNANDASIHQAYLWFLLDNELIKPLKKELTLLKRNRALQKKVAFPSVVTALKLQQSDLALRWLMPLLKTSKQIEYQVIYADLLELQDRAEGARTVRLKLFKRLNNSIKKNPKLLKDKEFARVYLGLVVRYITPYAKRAIYFEQFRPLFSKREFMEIEIGQYTYNGNSEMVRYLANKNSLNIPWLNLYLALSLNDNQNRQKLLATDKKAVLPFKDRVIASIDIGDRAGAYSLAFQGLEDNSRDIELFKIYRDMINSDYPKTEISSKYKNLTKHISVIDHRLSYRWKIYKGIESKISLNYYKYKQEKDSNTDDNSLSLALKNSNEKFSWDFSLSKHHTKNDFTSASLDLNYRLSEFELALKSKYQNKTTQTTKLQIDGMQSGVEFGLKRVLNQRVQVAMSYKKNNYLHQNRDKIGASEHIQISTDYLLRAGYPDMRFNAYLSQNSYENSMVQRYLPKDFIELGTQLSIGNSSKDTIHNSWRPFGTLGFAINNHNNIGTSISIGLSGKLKGEDILEVMFDYSKGIDAITSPYYGFHLNYKF